MKNVGRNFNNSDMYRLKVIRMLSHVHKSNVMDISLMDWTFTWYWT